MNADIWQIGILALVMIIAGGFGGYASYLSSKIEEGETYPCIKRILLGVAAAFAVPLFLNTISSSIISDAMSTNDYLVFAGFCVVAGFSSRAFLRSISQKLLDRLNDVERKQENLEEEMEPIIDRQTEPEDIGTLIKPSHDLDPEEIKVLKALDSQKYTRRYIAGIKSDTGYDDVRVNVILNKLKNEGLVNQRLGRKNLDLFWLTHEGRNYVRSL